MTLNLPRNFQKPYTEYAPGRVRRQDSAEQEMSPTRVALSTRAHGMETHPRGSTALDTVQRVLDALRRNFNGFTGELAGPYSEYNIRKVLQGIKVSTLEMLAFWSVDPSREAKQGVREALAILADNVDCHVVPKESGQLTLAEANARAMEAHAAYAAAYTRATDPNSEGGAEITPSEHAAMDSYLSTLERALAQGKAARNGLRRGKKHA